MHYIIIAHTCSPEIATVMITTAPMSHDIVYGLNTRILYVCACRDAVMRFVKYIRPCVSSSEIME